MEIGDTYKIPSGKFLGIVFCHLLCPLKKKFLFKKFSYYDYQHFIILILLIPSLCFAEEFWNISLISSHFFTFDFIKINFYFGVILDSQKCCWEYRVLDTPHPAYPIVIVLPFYGTFVKIKKLTLLWRLGGSVG